MISEALHKAQIALADSLRKAGEPKEARELLETIKQQDEDIKDIDLREAVWYLIGQGKVELTWDRRLRWLNGDS